MSRRRKEESMKKLFLFLFVTLLACGGAWAQYHDPCPDNNGNVEVSPAIKSVSENDEFHVTLEMDGCPEGSWTWQGYVEFDTDVLEFDGCTNLHSAFQRKSCTMQPAYPGRITLYFWNDSDPPVPDCDYMCDGTEAGTMIQLNFTVIGDSCDSTPLDLEGHWAYWINDGDDCPDGDYDNCAPLEDDGVVRVTGFNCTYEY
jgi:hypothetical protein